jgi:CelD/BcsL family acetyltransferase involved in cellulose biosynthesis
MADLERLRGDWERLLGQSAGLHPSLTPTWLLTWWRVFGGAQGRRLHALAVYRGRELVGLLPLLARRHWYRGLVPLRRLELLASGEDREHEICSEYLGPLVASGHEDEVVGALADHLTATRSTWDEIAFSALDGRSPAVQRLEPAFRSRGFACESSVVGQCPYVALPQRWEQYLAALSADHRYVVSRSLRDFERWAGKTCQVEMARGHEDLRRGRAILLQLHERRWQAGGQSGVFSSPLFRRFHDMLMPTLLDRGELDLRWLSVNGEPVAISYAFVNENRVYFYQSGRTTTVPKGVRPGIVLHVHALRAAIEAGRSEYDFLGGDARYKLQLATDTRPLIALRVARSSLLEAARAAITTAKPIQFRSA